ncbi:hypothetical protein V8C37DRAFT_412929 [Trichoderma ceciliae]
MPCLREQPCGEQLSVPDGERMDSGEEGSKGDEPRVDAARSTRLWCIGAVTIGACLAIACLVFGIVLICVNPEGLGAPFYFSTFAHETLSLAINGVLTLSIDGMMFVHSVSLRWALYREGRLEYNTNIRLFTSSRLSGPNAWYINLVALSCLVLSYAASSVLLLPMFNDSEDPQPIMISAPALVALGVGLAGQAIIAAWCLGDSRNSIPTWSSNPLNNTLAAIQEGNITPNVGRCMLSVHQRRRRSDQGAYPAKTQGSAFRAQRTVRLILVLLSLLSILDFGWCVAIIVLASRWAGATLSEFRFNWDITVYGEGNYGGYSVLVPLSPLSADTSRLMALSYSAQTVICILFVFAVQGSQTIALHCVELLVNMLRDEGVWRRAYLEAKGGGLGDAPGARLSVNSFKAAASSWENVVLFIAKAVLHWVIGQSILLSIVATYDMSGSHLEYTVTLEMVGCRLLIFAVMAILMAFFAAYMALRRFRGCQPATLGHLQTLADLIDDWRTDEDGRLWWGGKNELSEHDDQVRHAGTSADKTVLAPISTTARYAGLDVRKRT